MSISSYHRPSLSASCLLAACMWECEGFFLGSPAPACQAWGFQLLRRSLPLRPWRQAHLPAWHPFSSSTQAKFTTRFL